MGESKEGVARIRGQPPASDTLLERIEDNREKIGMSPFIPDAIPQQKGALIMDEMEKYLAAIAVAVETQDKKAIELLEGFATYVYQELYAISNNTSGEEHAVWDGMLQRAQVLISKMAQASPEIWD